jgi:hypothetical protein
VGGAAAAGGAVVSYAASGVSTVGNYVLVLLVGVAAVGFLTLRR